MNRSLLSLIIALLLAACSKHDERGITGWLNVDVIRPSTGTSGVIVLGQNKETYRVRTGRRWKVLGSGHPCRHMVLGDGKAVIIDLNDRKGVQIIREGEESARPIRDVFGRSGSFFVVPGREAIDFYECTREEKPARCREVTIERYDLNGNFLKTFHAALSNEYPECRLLDAPARFDSAGTPYLVAQCDWKSQRVACLIVAPRDDGLLVRAVPKNRPAQCSDFSGLGLATQGLEQFEVLQ